MFKNMRMKSPYIRIYDVAILIVTMLCIVGICNLSFLSYRSTKKIEILSLQEKLQQYSSQSKNAIENEFEILWQSLEQLRNMPQIYNMNWEEQYDFLVKQIKYLEFENIFIMDVQGNGYYVSDKIVKNQANEDFFKNIMASNRYITEPFMEYYQDRSITTLTVPIYQNNTRVGTLCGTVDLKKVYTIFNQFDLGSQGNNFIINERGEYVSNSDMTLVHNKNSIFDNLGKNKETAELFKNSLKSNVEILDEIRINNEKYYISIRPLTSVKWYVVFIVPKEEILLPIKTFIASQIINIILGIILAFLSVSLLKRDFENRRLAYTDSLTKLNNRASFDMVMNYLEKKYKSSISIVCIDLNDFKFINDTFGHQKGDKLLADFGQILRDISNKNLFSARTGGDEFVLIIIDKSELDIEIKVDELLKRVDKYNNLNKQKIKISYGIATRYEKQNKSLKEIYKKADKNMYQYKSRMKVN